MEICITWNFCRICLQTPRETQGSTNWQMKDIFTDEKLVSQIYECSGIEMHQDDSLPQKICRKCLATLKHAVNFRTICRNSNDYLNSVIRKARSATSLEKLDKKREETMEMVEDIPDIIDDDYNMEAIYNTNLRDKRKRSPSSPDVNKKVKESFDKPLTYNSNMNISPASSTRSIQKPCHIPIRTIYITKTKDSPENPKSSANDLSMQLKQNNISQSFQTSTEEELFHQPDKNGFNLNGNIMHIKKESQLDSSILTADHLELCEEEEEDIEGSIVSVESNSNEAVEMQLVLSPKPLEAVQEAFEEVIDEESEPEDLYDSVEEITPRKAMSEQLKVSTKEGDDIVKEEQVDAEGEIFEVIEDFQEDAPRDDDANKYTHSDDLYYVLPSNEIKTESSNNENENTITTEELTGDSCEDYNEYDEGSSNVGNVSYKMLKYDELINESSNECVEQGLVLHYIVDEMQERNICHEQQDQEELDISQEANESDDYEQQKCNYLLDCETEITSHIELNSKSAHVSIQSSCRQERVITAGSTDAIFNDKKIIAKTKGRKKSSNENNWVCEVCGNHFTNRSLLNYHTRIHRPDKDHECELCFKRFKTAHNLTAHMRVHTGEKPYICHFCGRSFADRSTQIKHERTHTKEKPFECTVCGKSFSLSTTLRAHEKIHSGERPYQCKPCGKNFTLPHQLKAHKNTHVHRVLSLDQLD